MDRMIGENAALKAQLSEEQAKRLEDKNTTLETKCEKAKIYEETFQTAHKGNIPRTDDFDEAAADSLNSIQGQTSREEKECEALSMKAQIGGLEGRLAQAEQKTSTAEATGQDLEEQLLQAQKNAASEKSKRGKAEDELLQARKRAVAKEIGCCNVNDKLSQAEEDIKKLDKELKETIDATCRVEAELSEVKIRCEESQAGADAANIAKAGLDRVIEALRSQCEELG